MPCETGDTKDDPKNRSADENQDSHLNKVDGIEMKGAMEDSGDGWEGIGAKVRVVESGRAWVKHRDYPADEDDRGRQSDSPAEHTGNGEIELFVGERLHLDSSRETAIDHFATEDDDHDAEEDFESFDARLHQDACADE